jgi:hypothetical protein
MQAAANAAAASAAAAAARAFAENAGRGGGSFKRPRLDAFLHLQPDLESALGSLAPA